ncbi:hypothetical protein BME92_13430 [Klebsiella pneumoniae]|nr:hypothetical protein BME92_13430 [Klebsiella pneumoniae]
MMSLWDALRMNMMISYQELVRTFPSAQINNRLRIFKHCINQGDNLIVRFLRNMNYRRTCRYERIKNRWSGG